ncbi:MAG: SpoIIE family protein phosphatase, partial [Victivallales bacterium]|nr:SpoIIE family protein phosphatase [Victivallales bacterium]
MIGDDTFVEIEYYQRIKTGEDVCGDDFKTLALEDESRYIAVLSDGLGSGIKASLLAHMTTAMALKFTLHDIGVLPSAEIIMDSLPVCEVRKISYATFTVMDVLAGGKVRVVEMDNPPFIHLRGTTEVKHEKQTLVSTHWPDRELHITSLEAMPEDRLIFFSDGVSQAGLGHRPHKFGWRREGCLEYVVNCLRNQPQTSARTLSRAIVTQACGMNPQCRCIDDITCAVIYFRRPRRLRLLTGPPFKKDNDAEFAGFVRDFPGKTIVCGGTTAQILGRELGRPIKTHLFMRNKGLPPTSEMPGVDMITEGILTLTETARCLENDVPAADMAPAVKTMIEMFLESDVIEFIVGTNVNEAHQD